jgi:hypothetical protein
VVVRRCPCSALQQSDLLIAGAPPVALLPVYSLPVTGASP